MAIFDDEAELPPMPPSEIPDPEPSRPTESWRNVVAGEPAFPVKNLDGTWSAGGPVSTYLCVGPDQRPRCVHLQNDGRCGGPPTEEMRVKMMSCVSFKDKFMDRYNRG